MAAPTSLRLDDQLCFALYAATNAVTRSYRPLLARIGLTYPQYLVLLALWQDGPATVGAIAARLQLDSHAVSPMVGRLCEAGLVTRERQDDRRRVLVCLTEEGRDLEQAAADAQSQVVCATGLEPLHLARMRRELLEVARQLGAPDLTRPGVSTTEGEAT